VFYGAPSGDRPRLLGRRHSPRADHRLVVPTGVGTALRRSIPDEGRIVCLLSAQQQNPIVKTGFSWCAERGSNPVMENYEREGTTGENAGKASGHYRFSILIVTHCYSTKYTIHHFMGNGWATPPGSDGDTN